MHFAKKLFMLACCIMTMQSMFGMAKFFNSVGSMFSKKSMNTPKRALSQKLQKTSFSNAEKLKTAGKIVGFFGAAIATNVAFAELSDDEKYEIMCQVDEESERRADWHIEHSKQHIQELNVKIRQLEKAKRKANSDEKKHNIQWEIYGCIEIKAKAQEIFYGAKIWKAFLFFGGTKPNTSLINFRKHYGSNDFYSIPIKELSAEEQKSLTPYNYKK